MGKKTTKKTFRNWPAVFAFVISILALLAATKSLFCHFKCNSFLDDDLFKILSAFIAVCVTIIVSFQIFNSIDYRKTINEWKENIVNKEDFEKNISEQIAGLLKAKGDASRMTSVLLGGQYKPIWALGWMGKAMNNYYIACEEDPNVLNPESYESIIKDCFCWIVYHINCYIEKVNIEKVNNKLSKSIIFDVIEKENFDNPKELLKRTFKDIIGYRMVQGKMKKDNSKALYYEMLTEESEKEEKIITAFLTHLRSLITNNSDLKDCYRMLNPQQSKQDFDAEIKKYEPNVEPGKDPVDETFRNLEKLYTEDLKKELKMKNTTEENVIMIMEKFEKKKIDEVQKDNGKAKEE